MVGADASCCSLARRPVERIQRCEHGPIASAGLSLAQGRVSVSLNTTIIMGGCVSGCMSSKDKGAQVPNERAKETAAITAFSVEIDAPVAANESKIRRSPSMANLGYDEWRAKFYGAEWGSLVQLLRDNCDKYKTRPALGWRPIDKVVKEDVEQPDGSKKKLEVTYLSKTETMSFEQLWTRCVAFANALRAEGFGENTKVGLYEETRAEWLQACYGIWIAGAVGVTVYSNLGEDALIYALKEAEVPVIVLNGKQVPKLEKLCTESGVKCPRMIYTEGLPAGFTSERAVSFEDFIAKGTGEVPTYHRNPDETALIMYTSGTTGDPKGVIMSHGNLIAAIVAFSARLEDVLRQDDKKKDDKKKDDKKEEEPEPQVYVGYLPLAHSLEFAAENVMMMRGVMIGYGNPRTLTNTAAKPHGDLQEFKPTFFAGVPRIFDTIKKAVLAKLPASGLKRVVFDRAFEDRKAAMEAGMETPYYNESVFKLTRELLGGKVKAIASGAAPLSRDTQVFVEVCFNVSVMQGYGLTETCAVTTLQRMYDVRKESIGGLLSPVEVKLRDTDDFKHTDQPHPRGELLIRGAVVTQGYYKQESKTKEAWDKDGWFCTGDVAEIPLDGTLKIIGRTKALVKNLNGEYIALESLESTYVQNELVLPNGICVLVNQQRAYIGAIVLTDESKAMKFAKDNKIEGTWPEILKSDAFVEKAQASLAKTAADRGHKPFEQVKVVRFFNDEWTPENGILTAAMKLKRREIDSKYATDIEQLFAKE
jgi:long-chain acyl-CoA synthetase